MRRGSWFNNSESFFWNKRFVTSRTRFNANKQGIKRPYEESLL